MSNKALPAAAAVMLLIACPFILLIAATAGGAIDDPGICGPGGTATTIASVHLDAEQLTNARTIITTTAAWRPALPAYAAVIATATAYTEAKFYNSPVHHDHQSEGLFQQQPQYYPGVAVNDPVAATEAFLTRLTHVPDWQTIPLTQAASDVQRPREDLRNRYAQWQTLAQQLVARYWHSPAPAAPALSVPTVLPGATTPATPVSGGGVCAGDGGANPSTGGHGNNVAGSAHIPAGLTLTGSPAGDAAARYALAQLGKPYVFGAAGPDSFDCSGLTMAAWAAAGVALPHSTYTQDTAGTTSSMTAAVTGDLVFIPGSDGTPTAPGHVGMIAGATPGHLWIIQAPATGIPVEVTDASEWAGQIVAVRHIA